MNYNKRVSEFKKQTFLLNDNDKDKINNLINEYYDNLKIVSSEKKKILIDLMNIILYYLKRNYSIETILGLLSILNIGNFYNIDKRECYALDNIAKIYPLSMKYNRISIFRVSIYLTEKVNPIVLQMALNFTIKRFPHFATTIKTGFFWHYLEQSKVHYNIYEDSSVPCQKMKLSKYNSHAFRVRFYEKRISLEFFHILTDGTGGLIFLKTLANEYLRLLDKKVTYSNDVFNVNDMPLKEEITNEYSDQEKTKVNLSKEKFAVQQKGKLCYIRPCSIIHIEIDNNELKKVSQNYNTKITPFILAVLLKSSVKSIDRLKGSITIQLPVNMRNYKQTKTLRNYALYCTITYPIEGDYSYPKLLRSIEDQLTEGLKIDNLNAQMAMSNKLVRTIKYIPLLIKRILIRVTYLLFSEYSFTTTLSNLGKVELPKSMSKEVEKFDFILGTTSLNRSACAMIGYDNKTVLSISKNTLDQSFENNVIKELQSEKINIIITRSSI